ncbi:hypothetical protein CY35_02G179900 [Sphagnum magellanicum]|nr:hypothetical protein CY35_02G179900 [Sphagnum magellanicum]
MAWRIGREISKLSDAGSRHRFQSLIKTSLTIRGSTTKAELYSNGEQRITDNILQTSNGGLLYAGVTSKELLRTLCNLHLVGYEPVVDASIKVLTSPLMQSALFRVPLLQAVKYTAYSHFCAGENIAEASTTLKNMWKLGLRGILDYGLEDATDSQSCDKNLADFVNVVHQSAVLPSGSVSFACVKITAICPIQLLERVSNLLRWQHKNAEFKLPWRQEVMPVLANSSPTYHVKAAPEPLTREEENDLSLAHLRLWKLCEACDQEGVPLMVDAEYSSVQPAIDYMVHAAALDFNKGSQPLVYGTIQAYLKDAFPRLSLAAKDASKRGISYGVKLVRGAYLSREVELASSLHAPSPIHKNIEETHSCYDSCAAFMLEQAACGDGSVVLATHNMDSGRIAALKAEELGLSKEDPRLQFAQLKGMADVLSLALAHAGFRVSKYLAFGPVYQVVPYLVRRAQENRGLLGNTALERQFIRRELRRRLQESAGL